MTIEEVKELYARWNMFFDKMKERSKEIVDEGLAIGEDILITNKDTSVFTDEEFDSFMNSITAQLREIEKKSSSVFDQQINDISSLIRDAIEESGAKDIEPVYELIQRTDEELRAITLDFEARRDSLYIKHHNPYNELEYLKKTYNEQTANVNCSQCGGKIEINELYIMPVYVACPFCNTQNTFMPPSVSAMLRPVAARVASMETADKQNLYIKNSERRRASRDTGEILRNLRSSEYEAFCDYVNSYYSVMTKIVPALEEAYTKERDSKIEYAKKSLIAI